MTPSLPPVNSLLDSRTPLLKSLIANSRAASGLTGINLKPNTPARDLSISITSPFLSGLPVAESITLTNCLY